MEAIPMKENKYEEWNVSDALSTLKRAEEILDDKKMIKLVSVKIKKDDEANKQVAKKLALEAKVSAGLKKVMS